MRLREIGGARPDGLRGSDASSTLVCVLYRKRVAIAVPSDLRLRQSRMPIIGSHLFEEMRVGPTDFELLRMAGDGHDLAPAEIA